MSCFCTREDNIKIAKVLLQQVLAEKERTVKEVYAYCKNSGITKSIIKEARKEMGIISENREGVQYWRMSERREQR